MSTGRLPWDNQSLPPSREQLEAYAEEHGVSLDVPAEARKLGCMNCRVGDRLRHPELGMCYCANCPVNIAYRRRQGLA